ncbi:MAG: PKD domain-containing protein [Chitinivibrionales bacterium]|nr:PKD domain-containing protein [Chitinivibrionales bacterium]
MNRWISFAVLVGAVQLLFAGSNDYNIDVSSYFGGSGSEDAIYGSVILSDGSIVLGGVIGDKKVSGVTETLLNGATGSSAGAVVRLASDGKSVLSITRIADKVVDIAVDGSENIYCASMSGGIIILDKTASSVIHAQTFDHPVHRVDAGPSGHYAILICSSTDFLTQKIASVTIKVFGPSHQELGSFGGNSHYTRDVCIHEPSQTIISLGFKNYSAPTDNGKSYPVDVPAYQGMSYSGTRKYDGYNYASSELNSNSSNMADARGHRCAIGKDGNLYMVFEVDGGNHVFDNDPFDVMTDVDIAGGDLYSQGSNVGTEPSLFYGRYEPSSGAYGMGQYFTTRLDNGRGNTIRIYNGAIAADTDGTIYLAGVSASGLPMTFDPTGGYTGGAYLVIVKSDFSQRLFSTRLSSGGTHTIALAENTDGSSKVLWAGSAKNSSGYSLYTRNTLQAELAGEQDGFFAFISETDGQPGNTPPMADFIVRPVSGTTLEFDASATHDPDGDALEYIWGFNDSASWGSGAVVQHTYPSPLEKSYRVALTVRDEHGGWDQKSFFFGPPKAAFSVSTKAGQAPLQIDYNAGTTTDPNDSLSALKFNWYFVGNSTASGETATFTYTGPGAYKPILFVADNMAGVDSASEILLVAEDESEAKRFDFGKPDQTVEPGFINAGAELYSSSQGYGWERITDDIKTGSWSSCWDDKVCMDGIELVKYASGERFDGEFKVDLANGTYTVLMHFMQKYSYGFNGVEAEEISKIDNVNVVGCSSGGGVPQVNLFIVDVTDGQLNLVFRRGSGGYARWFVCGIQIVPGEYAIEEQTVKASPRLSVQPVTGSKGATHFIYDVAGRCIKKVQKSGDGVSSMIRRDFRTNRVPGVYVIERRDERTMEKGIAKRLIAK